jgi:hypothetical protein
MLAAGGVLGLLLMGAAVSGLLAGTETSADVDDDDHDRALREDNEGQDAAMRSTEWDGHVDDADSLDPEPDKQDVQSPLGLLLFGEKHAAAGAMAPAVRASIGGGAGPAEFDDDIFAPLDQQDHWSGHGHAAVGMINEASLAIDQGPWTFDVVDTIPYPGGPDIPCVLEFECESDRLILDFDGTAAEAPIISIDHETLPGHAIVQANGIPVTLVEGASGMTPQHVSVAMSGTSQDDVAASGPHHAAVHPEADETPARFGAAGARDIGATAEPHGSHGSHGSHEQEFFLSDETSTIDDFDPEADQIEILYDPEVYGDPVVEVVDFEDGSGASIHLNGEPILHVKGAQGLDPSHVVLGKAETMTEPAPSDA